MKPGKIIIIAVLVLFIGLIMYEIVNFSHMRSAAQSAFQAVDTKLQAAKNENAELSRELEYYSHPENLEKELRARFNYKKPGENMIIVVPTGATSTASSTPSSTTSQ
jgi:type II secretory pathway pseudopilin PulG